MLWVRSLDAVQNRALPGTEGASFPFWAPDGRTIGFFAGDKLKRIDVAGGMPLVVTDAPNGRGGAWNADGVILFVLASTLHHARTRRGGPSRADAVDTAAARITAVLSSYRRANILSHRRSHDGNERRLPGLARPNAAGRVLASDSRADSRRRTAADHQAGGAGVHFNAASGVVQGDLSSPAGIRLRNGTFATSDPCVLSYRPAPHSAAGDVGRSAGAV